MNDRSDADIGGLSPAPEFERRNPLKMHFRSPAIVLSLPSGGRFWEPGSLDGAADCDVYPMTARDEMSLNTPDALVNGQGVVDIIESCIPSIRNAWAMPSVDLDRILIAIRIATYGERMDFESRCPECGDQNSFELDLHPFIERNVDMAAFDEPKRIGDLTLRFRPQNYRMINDLNMENFELGKLAAALGEETEEDDKEKVQEKSEKINRIFKRIAQRTVHILTGAIESIIVPSGETVSDPEFIEEFLNNCESRMFTSINEEINRISDAVRTKEIDATCSACGHGYTMPFTFDVADFFGSGS